MSRELEKPLIQQSLVKLHEQIKKGDLDKRSYEGLILKTKTEIGDYRMITKDDLSGMMPLMNIIYSHEEALKERYGEEFRREDSDSFAILNLVLEKTEGLSEEEGKGFREELAPPPPAPVARVRPVARRLPNTQGSCSIQ